MIVRSLNFLVERVLTMKSRQAEQVVQDLREWIRTSDDDEAGAAAASSAWYFPYHGSPLKGG